MINPQELTTKLTYDQMIVAIIAFGKTFNFEEKHSRQVTDLALSLFDQLQELHQCAKKLRLYLEAAGLLHDIGWISGRDGHHKKARDLIIGSQELPFTAQEKIIIGLIARYHRRSLPESTHKYYCDLKSDDREIVRKLSAILRVADALDRAHRGSVKNMKCIIAKENVVLELQAVNFSLPELMAVQKKSDLFEDVFKKKVVVKIL